MTSPCRSTGPWLGLLTVAFGIGLAGPAMAREGHALLKACQADRARFCAAEKPGGGRLAGCLQQHEAELAPECRSAMATVADCAPQVQSICGAASGAAALRSCVEAHAGEFSASCRAGLAGGR